jgi:hypothetical protein
MWHWPANVPGKPQGQPWEIWCSFARMESAFYTMFSIPIQCTFAAIWYWGGFRGAIWHFRIERNAMLLHTTLSLWMNVLTAASYECLTDWKNQKHVFRWVTADFFSEDIGSSTEHEYTYPSEPAADITILWSVNLPTSLHYSFSFQHNIMKPYPLCLEYHPLTPWLPNQLFGGAPHPKVPTSPVTYQLHIFLFFPREKQLHILLFFRNKQLNIF